MLVMFNTNSTEGIPYLEDHAAMTILLIAGKLSLSHSSTNAFGVDILLTSQSYKFLCLPV